MSASNDLSLAVLAQVADQLRTRRNLRVYMFWSKSDLPYAMQNEDLFWSKQAACQEAVRWIRHRVPRARVEANTQSVYEWFHRSSKWHGGVTSLYVDMTVPEDESNHDSQ